MERFFIQSIGKVPDKYTIKKMITEVCKMIGNISPRFLDHQIWIHQRNL